MRDYADLTRRLADLIVCHGANVQPGQIVQVSTYLGNEQLTREVARSAYQRGAKWVDVISTDLYVKRERLLHADGDTLDFVPQWMIDRLDWLADEGGARISLSGLSQPDALDGVDPVRAGRDLLPYLPNLGAVIDRNTTGWCVAPCPTPAWAKVVYPDSTERRGLRPALGRDRARLPARRARSRGRLAGTKRRAEGGRGPAHRPRL